MGKEVLVILHGVQYTDYKNYTPGFRLALPVPWWTPNIVHAQNKQLIGQGPKQARVYYTLHLLSTSSRELLISWMSCGVLVVMVTRAHCHVVLYEHMSKARQSRGCCYGEMYLHWKSDLEMTSSRVMRGLVRGCKLGLEKVPYTGNCDCHDSLV